MRSLLPLQIPDSTALGGGGSFQQVPIEGSTPDRPELSEAECDIDTLKKLKLGMRSSLWSRPSATNNNGSGGGGGGVSVSSGGGNNGNNNGSNNVQHPQSNHPSDYSIAV